MAAESSKIPIVGIVGGVASGKSFVADQLRRRGAHVIDADAIGHQVLQRPLVARSIANAIGNQVLDMSGHIDRAKLAELVFGTDELSTLRRRLLEMTVHPAIHADVVRAIRRVREQSDPPPIIVIDAPLLIEAGWDKMCDHLVFVDALPDIRLQRAMRRGWSPEQFQAREASQMRLEEKRARADLKVVSEDDPAAMERQIDQLWKALVPNQ